MAAVMIYAKPNKHGHMTNVSMSIANNWGLYMENRCTENHLSNNFPTNNCESMEIIYELNYWASDHYKILHMSQQLCCSGMGKILLWPYIFHSKGKWYPN